MNENDPPGPEPEAPEGAADQSQAAQEYWKTLAKADYEASQAYDRLLITLSSGALALSVTFIKEIAKSPIPGTLAALVLGWGSLVLSLLMTLSSLLTSQRSLRRTMAALGESGGTLAGAFAKGRPWAVATQVLNAGAAIALTGGLVGVVTFAAMNYGGAHGDQAKHDDATHCKPTPHDTLGCTH